MLTIDRAGQSFVDSNFAAACGGFTDCQAAADPYGAPAVSVLPADGASEPDIFVHLTNGGNICCRSTIIYHYDTTAGAYTRSVHVYGNAADSGPAQSLGHPLNVYFVSDDGRFRYRFGCGACTPGPIQIWHDQVGVLVDVTRQFPSLIAKDARRWLRLFYKRATAPYGADGFLVAWVADEELLRHDRAAWQLVYRLGREGLVTRPGSGFGKPTRFYKQLRGFLRRLGYITG